MLKVLYKNGSIDGNTFELDPALYEGLDPMESALGDLVMSLVGGKLATIGADGFVALAVAEGNINGVIVNDASGVPLFNKPAMASGKVPLMFGGGLIITDQVVEDNIVAGAKLYCGSGVSAGLWTSAQTDVSVAQDGSDMVGDVIGIAMSSNSATDKTLKIQSKV